MEGLNNAWEWLGVLDVQRLGRHGRVQRRLAKRPPRAEDARAFSLAWDAAIRKVIAAYKAEADWVNANQAEACRLHVQRNPEVEPALGIPPDAAADGCNRHRLTPLRMYGNKDKHKAEDG